MVYMSLKSSEARRWTSRHLASSKADYRGSSKNVSNKNVHNF